MSNGSERFVTDDDQESSTKDTINNEETIMTDTRDKQETIDKGNTSNDTNDGTTDASNEQVVVDVMEQEADIEKEISPQGILFSRHVILLYN